MKFRVPSSIDVTSITVDRDRAEVTDVDIGFYRDELPIIDGFITPQQTDGNQYKISNPASFKRRDQDYYLFADGTWRWGNTPGQSFAKQAVDYYVDRIIVSLWTGNNEPSNTRVIFHLGGNIISHSAQDAFR